LFLVCLLLGCPQPGPGSVPESSSESAPESTPPDSEREAPLWVGEVQARVVDADGLPIEGAWVTQGGWAPERWALSDVEGLALVTAEDDGVSAERFILAGKPGWFNAGTQLDDEGPAGTLEIVLLPLPTVDNPEYGFQKAGEGNSPDTSYCGHCHIQIADDWNTSAHSRAASSFRVWDLYTGRATQAAAEDCEALGGQLAEGQAPGEEGVTETACYLEQGVLPWLNDCEVGCDHPDQRAGLSAFGSCGDCHSPATDAGVPGQIDLAASFGVAHEGVTCDLCHKVRDVTAGGSPGLDGALHLLRPSEPGEIAGLEWSPIMFGPYPDVVNALMSASYNPLFREPEFCSACHEYSQPALHPDQRLDAERWPQGLPVMETWSEFVAAGADEAGFSCQGCHMPSLLEDSSTYDFGELGVSPSSVQGWLRAEGEVKHHDFPRAEVLGDPLMELSLATVGETLELTVELTNTAAHAAPTGEPMRQILVLVTAEDEAGAPVAASGGQAIGDQGGFLASGRLGSEVELSGSTLTIEGAEGALVARFVRPTGDYQDYPGPGTSWFSGELSPEDKGLALEEVLFEVPVASVGGGQVQLESAPAGLQAGDRVYLCADGHHAGAAGWLYAKTLVSAEGERGVAHYRAVDIASDNRIAPLSSVQSAHEFPATAVTLTATMIRRDQAAPVADTYGWDYGDRSAGSVSMSSSE
jgi:hypothetical protein